MTRWILLAGLGLVAIVVAGCGVADAEPPAAAVDRGRGGDGRTAPEDDGQGSQSEAAPLEATADTIPRRPEVVIPASWDSEVEEVYGRYWLYWEAFAAAHAPPNADPGFEPLRELSTEENWRSLQEQLIQFAADGLVLVLPENSKSEHLLRIPNAAVLDREEGAEVVLQDCWIDDFTQQTVDGQVLLETEEAKLMNVMMKVVKGQWRVDGVSRATAESDGYEQCVALVSQ